MTVVRENERRQRILDWIFIALGLVALWAIPHRISGDGEIRYHSLAKLLTSGELSVPRYSLVGPLFATPLFFVGRWIGHAPGLTAHLNAILFTLSLFLFARELEADFGGRRTRAAILLFVYASMFTSHVQVFYGEVFTALAVALGVFWLARASSAKQTVAAWTAIVLGVVNTPAAVLGASAIAVRAVVRTRRFGHLLAPPIAFGLTCLENYVTRGGPFTTGYEGDVGPKTLLPYSAIPGFSYPFFFGLLGVFFSFGKGLVFFTPGLFAPLANGVSERLRWVHGSLLAFTAGLVLVYARWWAWGGNWFWGPRFFLIASVIASITIASHMGGGARRSAWKDGLLLGAIALSFWVGVNGLVFDTTGLALCEDNDYMLEPLCVFTPEYSVLWHPFVDFRSTVPEKSIPIALGVCAFWVVALGVTARETIAALASASARWAADALVALRRWRHDRSTMP